MNETENNFPSTADLTGQIAALQRQVFTLLLVLIVVSGTLSAFLCYQSHVAGKDTENIRPQAMQLINNFNQVSAGIDRKGAENFVNQLIAYGQAHPEFRPVLQKYGINVTAPAKLAATALPPKK
jgi:hypothetical protein